MSKDPAFLFYPNDFEAKTKLLTNEQVGIYLRLLMTQFQQGHLPERKFKMICPTMDEDILVFFDKDADGNYYQDRLEREINRRKNFTASRRNNLSGKNQHSDKTQKEDHMTSHMEGHMTSHMETENETVNVTEDIIENKRLRKVSEKTIFSDYLENCPNVKKIKNQLTQEQAQKLIDEFGQKACEEIFEAMENYGKLKNYRSVYLTAKIWLGKRKQTATTNGKQKSTFTEAAMDWLDRTS